MSPSNDRRQKMKAVTRTVGAAIATAGLLFASAASVAASGAAEDAGHPQANVALDQTGCGLIPLDVELIIDRSGSMGDNSTDGHTRMYWAQHAADQLVDGRATGSRLSRAPTGRCRNFRAPPCQTCK